MKCKILFILLVFFHVPVSHAGLGKVFAEFFEEYASKAGKVTSDSLDGSLAVTNTARVLRPALKNVNDLDSVEYSVISFIYDDRDICNTYDTKKYVSFVTSRTHKDSPAMDALLDTTHFERYKMLCEIDDIKFIGHGESVDEVSKYAYAEVSAKVTVNGLLETKAKSIYILKLEGNTWKFWENTFLNVEVELLNESWWLYNPIKRECFSVGNDTGDYIINPLILLEESKNMDCATEGMKDNILIVSCKDHVDEARSYYAYSPKKEKCEEFGEKVMNVRTPSY